MLGIEPNTYSNIIHLFNTTVGMVAFVPQIVKTIKSKSAKDISLLSWFLWIFDYTLMVIYIFIFTVDKFYFVIELFEVALCVWFFFLCLKYRSKKGAAK
jgi:uncharacterized protein with PQ loop repeat